jgi:excisionase family DNA binding protein
MPASSRGSWTVREIAEEMQVSQDTVLVWIHRGDLKAVNVSPKISGPPRWRITRQAFDEFLESGSGRHVDPGNRVVVRIDTPNAGPVRADLNGAALEEPGPAKIGRREIHREKNDDCHREDGCRGFHRLRR